MAKDKPTQSIAAKKASKSSKSGKSATSAIFNLSEEFVVDSDEEGAQRNPVVIAQNSKKPRAADSQAKYTQKSKSEGDSRKEPSASVNASSSATDESSSDTGSTTAEEEESSDEDSGSSSEGERTNLKNSSGDTGLSKSDGKTNGVKRKAHAQSSSDDGSEVSSTSSESDNEHNRKRSKSSETPRKASQMTKHVSIEEASSAPSPDLVAVPPDPYEPPEGFTAAPYESSKSLSSLLNLSDLDGKQLWYITAPRKLPLDSLVEFPLENIQAQQPILSHHNINYLLREDINGDKAPSLLLPSKNGYALMSARISKSFHLEQHISLPKLSSRQAKPDTGSLRAGNINHAPVKTVIPQPKGLRMRFKPTGFGGGELGHIGSASEEEDDTDGEVERGSRTDAVQLPKTLGVHGPSEHIKKGDVPSQKPRKDKNKEKAHRHADPDITSTPKKKKKKDKSEKSKSTSHEKGTVSTIANTPIQKVVAPDIDMIDAPTSTSPKTKKTKRKGAI